MDNLEPLDLIKESFETWYNREISKDIPVSIVINYSDVQKMSIKAFHTVSIEMSAVGIRDNLSFITSIAVIRENYNHGITSEQEAKNMMIQKLLTRLYSYKC